MRRETANQEDFQWEEFYVVGPGAKNQYEKLKRTQPSYKDRYDLLCIEMGTQSDWMMFPDDIAARVRRRPGNYRGSARQTLFFGAFLPVPNGSC